MADEYKGKKIIYRGSETVKVVNNEIDLPVELHEQFCSRNPRNKKGEIVIVIKDDEKYLKLLGDCRPPRMSDEYPKDRKKHDRDIIRKIGLMDYVYVDVSKRVIKLNDLYLELVGVKNEVKVAGVRDWIELWDPEHFEKVHPDHELADICEEILFY